MKTFRILSLNVALVALVVVTARAQPKAPPAAEDIAYSLLRNSGFEQGLEGWRFSNGWSAMNDELRARVIEVRSDGALAGQRYLRVTNNQNSGFYGVEQAVRWEPNTMYKISWWSRGQAKQGGHERGANRLRIWGYGGPEYSGDISYRTTQWTYHEYTLLATSGGDGGFSLWTWPDGYCDIDNLMVRKAFWTADRPELVPGQTVNFRLDMSGPRPEQVRIEARLSAADGTVVRSESIEGMTPLRRSLPIVLDEIGYYTFTATARTSGGIFEDRFGVSVISPQTGMDAVRREWARPR